MPHMQITIRLRRKTRYYRFIFTVLKVFLNDLFDKIQGFFFNHAANLERIKDTLIPDAHASCF
jgi:hypothetical protein